MGDEMKLGRVEREILRDLSDGDVRSLAELGDGHPYISACTALASLESKGLIETWYDTAKPPQRRKLARLTKSTLDAIQGHD